MPVRIQAPDGSIAEFPDGTSDATITAVMKKSYPPPQPTSRSLLGALGEGAANLPGQVAHYVNNLDLNPANAGGHAADALSSLSKLPGSLAGIGAGVLQQTRELSPPEARGSAPPLDKAPALAAETALYDRYGAMPGPQRDKPGFNKQNLYNTLATDPAGAMLDASTLLAGPETLGARGRLVEALTKGSHALNPVLAPVKAAELAAGLSAKAEPLVSGAIGRATGVGTSAVREAAKAGAKGGRAGEAFTANLRGTADAADIVPEAKAALDKMYQARADRYRTEILPVSTDPTVLNFDGIEKAVQNVANRGTYKGVVVNGKASGALDEIKAAVEEWKALDPHDYHTAEGMDALKRKIGDIWKDLPPRTPASDAAGQVYNAVKDEIVQQAPEYGKVMKDYEEASKHLRELQNSLSLGGRASTDTAVRKLQSALRDDAQTGFSTRGDFARELEDAGGSETLLPGLAGQAMSPIFPRGIAGQAATAGEGLGMMLGHGSPHVVGSMLAAASLTSPRLAGELLYGAGKAGSVSRRVAEQLKADLPVKMNDANRAALLSQMLARMQSEQQQ